MAHLSDDKTVAKMGHPDLDVSHPATIDSSLCAMAHLSDDETVAKMGTQI